MRKNAVKLLKKETALGEENSASLRFSKYLPFFVLFFCLKAKNQILEIINLKRDHEKSKNDLYANEKFSLFTSLTTYF